MGVGVWWVVSVCVCVGGGCVWVGGEFSTVKSLSISKMVPERLSLFFSSMVISSFGVATPLHISRGLCQYLASFQSLPPVQYLIAIICISDQKLNDGNSWRQWYNVNSLGAHTYTHTQCLLQLSQSCFSLSYSGSEH